MICHCVPHNPFCYARTRQQQKQQTAGLPDSADLKLTLQLTSPIEEATLTAAEPAATFRSVELGQAMLSMSAADASVPLGVAESVDLASLIKLDAMSTEQHYAVEQNVGFKADGSHAKEDEPVFHATLEIKFVPSPKDQREELYELLNKATTKKNQAVEKLRQTALAASRQQQSTAVTKKPAVKPGFLNKGAGKKDDKGILHVLDKYFGPRSFLRQVFPVAKNYVIFFAAAAIFHFKGDMLSLPPPV